jgi:transcriptional regulator NrdR family protein
MKCPICGVWTLIKETRKQDDNSKARRYECGNLHTFRTVEHITKIIGQNAKQNKPSRKALPGVA